MSKRHIIPYNPNLIARARELRKSGTKAEALLWKKLQNRQVCGYKFLRQRPIDEYIVDFYCPDLALIIEIDGITHENKIAYDRYRQERLENLGLHFLRFWDDDVIGNPEGVVQYIENWIKQMQQKE
ncbi:endonuclease domain-containing protein [Desulfovermiculus halophilus]|jgi:very-short-patch-repair endonuclease|uniref:endonuclease domain-containing protein n=1 Tax=Desulfovermiculus halophilus TaxID=339722 RepID=UPI0004865CB3|nr:DUF559 domain-containing protein [Desulfovermiculus halophilus]